MFAQGRVLVVPQALLFRRLAGRCIQRDGQHCSARLYKFLQNEVPGPRINHENGGSDGTLFYPTRWRLHAHLITTDSLLFDSGPSTSCDKGR